MVWPESVMNKKFYTEYALVHFVSKFKRSLWKISKGSHTFWGWKDALKKKSKKLINLSISSMLKKILKQRYKKNPTSRLYCCYRSPHKIKTYIIQHGWNGRDKMKKGYKTLKLKKRLKLKI